MKLYFELKTKGKEAKEGTVRAVISDNGNKALIPTGLKAKRTEFESGKFKNTAALQSKKDKLREYETAFSEYLTTVNLYKELPTLDNAKAYMLASLNKETSATKNKNIDSHFKEYKKDRQATGKFKEISVKQYTNLFNHINDYKPNTTLNDINKKWAKGFVEYLSKEVKHKGKVIKAPTQIVTINKLIAKLKAYCKWCYENKYTLNNGYTTIKRLEATAQRINVLTKAELTKYYLHKFDKPYLERTRDIACFVGFTGLRYQDLSQVTRDNIKVQNNQYYLHINTSKTNAELRLPLTNEAIKILDKYNYQLPIRSNQKINTYIKEGLKESGITSTQSVNINTVKGTTTKQVLKADITSIHDFRKTFITICLIEGLSVTEVMKLSTHSEYKSFQVYVALADTHLADKLNSVSFVNAEVTKPKSHLKKVV